MEEMKPHKKNSTVLARALLILCSSGVLINTAFLIGRAHYQGVLRGLGFEFELFPLASIETYISAYYAVVYRGLDLIQIWNQHFVVIVIAIWLAVYLFIVAWKSLDQNKDSELPWLRNRILRITDWTNANHPMVARLSRWIFFSSTSEQAGIKAYYVLLGSLTILTLLVSWFFAPSWIYLSGIEVAEELVESYENSLCEDKNTNWNWCIRVPHQQGVIEGRLIVRNEELLGIYTSDGPVIVSMPEEFYFKRKELESDGNE